MQVVVEYYFFANWVYDRRIGIPYLDVPLLDYDAV